MQQMRVTDRKRAREREEERERYSEAADMLTDPVASPAISAATAATERVRERERAQLQPCPLSLTHEYANMRWLASSPPPPLLTPLAALLPFTWIAALFINLPGPEQARQDTLAGNAVVAFAAITAADMDIDMLHGHGHCCLLIDCSHLGIDVVYSATPWLTPPSLSSVLPSCTSGVIICAPL